MMIRLRSALLALTVVALVGLVASPAEAHDATVDGRPFCTEAGVRQITWTATNDVAIPAVVTWSSPQGGTFGENPTDLAASGASQTLQQLPGATVGTVDVTAHTVWSDEFTADPTGEVALPSPCPTPPPPPSSTTTTTTPPPDASTTTSTTLPPGAAPPSDPGTPTPGPTLPVTGPSAQRQAFIHNAQLAGFLALLVGLTILGLVALAVKPKRGDTLGR